MKRILLISLSIVIFFAAIFLTIVFLDKSQESDQTEMGFLDSAYQMNNFFPMILNGVAMILGIVFGFFYQRFTDLQKEGVKEVNIKKEVSGLFRATGFYLALAASPIIFGIIISVSKGVSLTPSLLLAFQNGFFWQHVMPKGFTNPGTEKKPKQEGSGS